MIGSAWNWPKSGQTHAEIKYSNQSKISTYGNKKYYFRPYIIHRYLIYVYQSAYFLGEFFNQNNYKNRTHSLTAAENGRIIKQWHWTEASTTEPLLCCIYHPVNYRYCYRLTMRSVSKMFSPVAVSTMII